MNTNLILNSDSYKASHWLQYPEGSEYIFYYVESRGGKWDDVTMFGLQGTIKEYLTTQITTEMIDQAEKFILAHGEPFNREGWEYIVNELDGYLPLEIRAIPEGLTVPGHNVMATIVNTDPECFWLGSYIETIIVRGTWYGTTVATQSRYIKKLILSFLEKTGDPSGLMFKLHDFGARGVSSFESAGIGGAAHLVNFMGSDTMSGALYAQEYYNTEEMVSFSIPAAEHSTQTILMREGEPIQQKRMLEQFGGKYPLIAIVSDSYDIYESTKRWATSFRQDVIDSKSTIIIRPDSGKPSEVVLRVLETLDRYLPEGDVTVNDKGYKVLPDFFRVIQGDGINIDSIKEILETIVDAGWSADNLAFGMGGALLQQINRDTLKFAMKASAARINGEWVDVYKDPITDIGKVSKKGRMTLYRDSAGNYITDQIGYGWSNLPRTDVLKTVFLNGKMIKEYTFEEVRENAKL
ncbi:MAG: nicotinate phosphoribosyltransferase [Candidatus Peribacteraceae bacterium]|nr:nicotinate phosphoribosyltransferase [Candidatus Peribacteraceae bacterium]